MIVTRGKTSFQIDDRDLSIVQEHNWNVFRSKGAEYIYRYVYELKKQRRLFLHRELLKPAPGYVVDHINGDTKDNRRANLRICSQGQNCKNKFKRAGSLGSGYVGVQFDATKKLFKVCLCCNGKRHYLGRFKSEAQAALTYNIFANIVHDGFAKLNIISLG